MLANIVFCILSYNAESVGNGTIGLVIHKSETAKRLRSKFKETREREKTSASRSCTPLQL